MHHRYCYIPNAHHILLEASLPAELTLITYQDKVKVMRKEDIVLEPYARRLREV
jgi:hypothetical protein